LELHDKVTKGAIADNFPYFPQTEADVRREIAIELYQQHSHRD
jgi:predicted HTH domain antitoxin